MELQSCFDCKICFETLTDPVLTSCGHVYFWPCLYRWIHYKDGFSCPVCKEELTEMDVMPIYGCGRSSRPQAELGFMVPPRPHARRIKRSDERIPQGPTSSVEEMVQTITDEVETIPRGHMLVEDGDLVPNTVAVNAVGLGSRPRSYAFDIVTEFWGEVEENMFSFRNAILDEDDRM